VKVKDMQRLAGRLQSMKLALEGVAVWTRGLYADIAKALEESGGRASEGTRTHLREAALADLSFWAYRLGKQNGLPIADAVTDVHVTMQCDASDVGWGAHTDEEDSKVAGTLPAEVLGGSSTARELTGLLQAVKQMEHKLRGRRVEIRMDSHPAICNLIRGGGRVEGLCSLVREWWLWCKRHSVTPTYRWIPREANETADELSKKAAATYRLRAYKEKEIREWLEEIGQPGLVEAKWLQTRVQAPHWDNIGVRIQEMIRARKPACIIVPRWNAVWLPMLRRHSVAYLKLGMTEEVLEREASMGSVRCLMEAHVLTPEP
jgi:ribonuclease HI